MLTSRLIAPAPRIDASNLLEHLRRALTRTARRDARPLAGADSWSAQTEVAFYEEAAFERPA